MNTRVSRRRRSALGRRTGTTLPKLRPVPFDGSTSGSWSVEGQQDLFIFRHPEGQWEAWAPQGTVAQQLLIRHELRGVLFSTRRDAHRATAAALDLDRRLTAAGLTELPDASRIAA